jgi:hypothetical protein
VVASVPAVPARSRTFPQLLPSIIYGTEIEFYDQTWKPDDVMKVT